MKIILNQDTGTIDITVSEDQISDELLGILPLPTATTADGCLTWSIGFSDAFRAPGTSSSRTGVTEDDLLGPVGAIVGAISSQNRASSVEAEGKIRGTLILTFNNSHIEESASTGLPGTLRSHAGRLFNSSASLDIIQRSQDELAAELNATGSEQINLGHRSTQVQSGLRPVTEALGLSGDVGVSNMLTLLFANPFGG